MLILLTVLSILAVLIFFGVLAIYVWQIAKTLEAIGGSPDSFLAKLRLGLRAIEQESSFLPKEVAKLNEKLAGIGAGLQDIDGHLVKTIDAVAHQPGGKEASR